VVGEEADADEDDEQDDEGEEFTVRDGQFSVNQWSCVNTRVVSTSGRSAAGEGVLRGPKTWLR
jgi:hypothetical protein